MTSNEETQEVPEVQEKKRIFKRRRVKEKLTTTNDTSEMKHKEITQDEQD